MSFTGLTKEQRLYLVLGGVVALILVVLMVFGVKVSLSSIGEAKLEMADLTSKIESAEQSLAKHSYTKEKFAETSDELRRHLQNIPPKRNYYSWATEIIYAIARLADLEIDGIDEQTGVGGKDDNTIKLESYSLRITAHGGFSNVKSFLELVEEDQPLVRVTGIDISTGSKLDVHDVQFFIQWPFNLSSITDAWEEVASKQQAIGTSVPPKTNRSPSKIPTPSAPRPNTAPKAATEEPIVPEPEAPPPKSSSEIEAPVRLESTLKAMQVEEVIDPKNSVEVELEETPRHTLLENVSEQPSSTLESAMEAPKE